MSMVDGLDSGSPLSCDSRALIDSIGITASTRGAFRSPPRRRPEAAIESASTDLDLGNGRGIGRPRGGREAAPSCVARRRAIQTSSTSAFVPPPPRTTTGGSAEAEAETEAEAEDDEDEGDEDEEEDEDGLDAIVSSGRAGFQAPPPPTEAPMEAGAAAAEEEGEDASGEEEESEDEDEDDASEEEEEDDEEDVEEQEDDEAQNEEGGRGGRPVGVEGEEVVVLLATEVRRSSPTVAVESAPILEDES